MINNNVSASLFVISILGALFDIFTLILLARFFLQWLAPNYFNPSIRRIYKLSAWLDWLHRIFPTFKGVDGVLLIAAGFLQFLKITFLMRVRFEAWPLLLPLILWALVSLINQTVNLFFYALLLRVLFSYMGFTIQNTFYEMLFVLTEPLLRILRRGLPFLSGWDFSPLVLALFLKLIAIFLVFPVLAWSEWLATQAS